MRNPISGCLPLVGRERTGLVQHRVGHTDLADVVKQGAAIEVHQVPPSDAAGVPDDQRKLRYPEGMVPHLVFPRVDGAHERLQGHEVGRVHMVGDSIEIGVGEITVLAAESPVTPLHEPVFNDQHSAARTGKRWFLISVHGLRISAFPYSLLLTLYFLLLTS
jgi:hypothetical protein